MLHMQLAACAEARMLVPAFSDRGVHDSACPLAYELPQHTWDGCHGILLSGPDVHQQRALPSTAALSWQPGSCFSPLCACQALRKGGSIQALLIWYERPSGRPWHSTPDQVTAKQAMLRYMGAALCC